MSATAIDQFVALQSPAAMRNRAPILEALRSRLPDHGNLLELASGALQHALFIAPHFPGLHWQTSEVDARVLALAPGYVTALAHNWPANVTPPICLDVAARPWSIAAVDVIYLANLLHIAPLGVTESLFAQAASTLKPEGQLILYGPFKQNGAFRSEGDAQFDATLRARNAEWGIRDLELLDQLAVQGGLRRLEALAMPANNLLLRFTPEEQRPVRQQ